MESVSADRLKRSFVRRSGCFCEAKHPAELEHERYAVSVGVVRQIGERRVSAHPHPRFFCFDQKYSPCAPVQRDCVSQFVCRSSVKSHLLGFVSWFEYLHFVSLCCRSALVWAPRSSMQHRAEFRIVPFIPPQDISSCRYFGSIIIESYR